MKREAPVMRVFVRGTTPIEATSEHPFYCRRRTEKCPHRGPVQYSFGEPEWICAGEMTESDYVGLPINFVPYNDLESFSEQLDAKFLAHWYLVGHYLGNGWIVNHKRAGRKNSRCWKVIICDGYDDADALAEYIKGAGFHATRSDERSGVKFHISSKEFVEFLAPFGTGAANKEIPGSVFNLPAELQAVLLRGWMDSDGYENGKVICGTTISKKLAMGMARLARSGLRIPTTIRKVEVPNKTVIEGRTVNQRPFYQVRCWKNSKAIWKWDEKICWSKVRKTEKTNEVKTVYNISVEEDESYVADECIVHNCQPFSTAGKRRGQTDDRYLWPEIIRVARLLKPTWIVGENVAGIISMEQPEPLFEVERDEKKLPVHQRVTSELIEELRQEGFLVPRYTDGTPIVFGIPASAVGACHRRERVFILAYSEDNRRDRRAAYKRWEESLGAGREEVRDQPGGQNAITTYGKIHGLQGGNPSQRRELENPLGRVEGWGNQPLGQDCNVADTDEGGCRIGELDWLRIQRGDEACNETGAGDQSHSDPSGERGGELLLLQGEQGQADSDPLGCSRLPPYVDCGERSQQFYVSRARWIRKQSARAWGVPWPEAATRFCRMDDGISARVDRIKSLGNAVVPAQIFPVFEAIAKIERMMA